jgi:hypothetical protein
VTEFRADLRDAFSQLADPFKAFGNGVLDRGARRWINSEIAGSLASHHVLLLCRLM